MRLAVFTSQFPSRVSTFFARDIRALVLAGMEVDVFPVYPLQADLWKYVPAWLDESILPRERVRHLGWGESLRSLKPWRLGKMRTILGNALAVGASAAKFGRSTLAKSMYVIPKAARWAEQEGAKYDHVFSYWGNYAATCAQLFHRLSGGKMPFSFMLHAGTDLYRDQVYLREKLLYADRIFTVCEFNRRFIAQKFPEIYDRIADRFQVHHLGLDFAEFPFQPEGRPPAKILGVGTFDKAKGFDVLIKAVARVRQAGQTIELDLVGDGAEEKAFKTLVAELGIADVVHFRGWLPFHEVRAAMSSATMLVHPSVGLGDAVPTVIKEALAVGTPVIGSDVVGIPELLDGGRCGTLVPPGDPEALAMAIVRLLQNPTERIEAAHRGRTYAESMFDLKRNGDKLAETMRNLRRLPCHEESGNAV